jgi:hypothetical protein
MYIMTSFIISTRHQHDYEDRMKDDRLTGHAARLGGRKNAYGGFV